MARILSEKAELPTSNLQHLGVGSWKLGIEIGHPTWTRFVRALSGFSFAGFAEEVNRREAMTRKSIGRAVLYGKGGECRLLVRCREGT
jgi:hypothetical protein